jgi:hypothetical protein
MRHFAPFSPTFFTIFAVFFRQIVVGGAIEREFDLRSDTRVIRMIRGCIQPLSVVSPLRQSALEILCLPVLRP